MKASRMTRQKPLGTQQLISALVGCLGMYVLVGWASGTEAMVRVLPNSVAVGVNTALLFIAAAVSIWPVSNPSGSHWLLAAVRYGLVLLPLAILFQHTTGIAIGIDWPSLHAAVKDANQVPGRVALNTCLGFLLTGFAVLGLAKPTPTKWQAQMIVVCAYGVLAIGIGGVIGYALHLEFLYRYAGFNRMALPAAIGLAAVGVGLWRAIRARAEDDSALPAGADIRITKTAIVVLTFVVLVTGFTGFFVMKNGFEESMVVSTLHNTKSYASAFEAAIDQQLVFSDIVAANPGLQTGLLELEKNPASATVIGRLGEIGQSFSAFGLTGFQLFNAKGSSVVSVGAMVNQQAVMSTPLARANHQAQLMWLDSFVLRDSLPIWREGRLMGYFVIEQRLSKLTTTLTGMTQGSTTTDVLVCGRDRNEALCFPSKFYPANTRIPMYQDGKPYLAISRALLNENGVMTVSDLRGVGVLAGYAPIGTLGLGLVLKTDAIEVNNPLRERLNMFIGMLIFLVAMGTFLLRAQVQPLAKKLLSEQRRVQVILDSSLDAFIEVDSRGIILDWNVEAARTFGWARREALGKELAQLILPLEFRDKQRQGMQRFLKTGEGNFFGKRMEWAVLHRNGAQFIVEITISMNEDNGRYTFSAFLHDISLRKADELTLSQSEKRMSKLARFDTLTGLPNRFQLNEKLEEAVYRCRRLKLPLTVMFLDIDHFKKINDTLGHAAGDVVLKEFALRLENSLRATDTAGRLAGDEFVVFMETPHGTEESVLIAEKIIAAMQGPWMVEGKELQVTTSIGVVFASTEILSADALLAKADGALYKAKSAGRNQFFLETC